MEMKDLALKVKKIVVEGSTNGKPFKEIYQGVIMPIWFDYNCSFSTNEFRLYTTDGEIKKFYLCSVKVENTRITDKNIKDKLDSLIEELKEEHKIRLEMAKLRNEYENKLKNLNSNLDKKKITINKKLEDVVKVQGFIPQNKFNDEVLKGISVPYDYSIELEFNGSKVASVILGKEVFLGKYLTNSNYDFIWNEYDNNVMIYHEDIPTSKDYAKIKKKYFKPVNISKIDKFKVSEVFDAIGGGDKGSADAYHQITLSFNKGLELKKENMKKVEEYIKEIIKNM